MNKLVYGWRTTQTQEGVKWEVYSFGYQIPNRILLSGVSHSRAVAVRLAKQNVMPYRRGVKQ